MSAGSFNAINPMMLAAHKSGKAQLILAAMTAMLPHWLRRSSRPSTKESATEVQIHHYYNTGHADLNTAHRRCSVAQHAQGKRAVRRNRHRGLIVESL